jgi:hypothetical protein
MLSNQAQGSRQEKICVRVRVEGAKKEIKKRKTPDEF